jgi:DNA-binding NarL/FixJ family response regulator
METNRLTSRELEVCKMVCMGMANKEIAYKLDLSEQVIKNYVTIIFQKLSVNNRVLLVLECIRREIIESPVTYRGSYGYD